MGNNDLPLKYPSMGNSDLPLKYPSMGNRHYLSSAAVWVTDAFLSSTSRWGFSYVVDTTEKHCLIWMKSEQSGFQALCVCDVRVSSASLVNC